MLYEQRLECFTSRFFSNMNVTIHIWIIRRIDFPLQKCSKEFIKFDFACIPFSRILRVRSKGVKVDLEVDDHVKVGGSSKTGRSFSVKWTVQDDKRRSFEQKSKQAPTVWCHKLIWNHGIFKILILINRYSRKVVVIKIKNLFRIVTSLFCCVCSKIGC